MASPEAVSFPIAEFELHVLDPHGPTPRANFDDKALPRGGATIAVVGRPSSPHARLVADAGVTDRYRDQSDDKAQDCEDRSHGAGTVAISSGTSRPPEWLRDRREQPRCNRARGCATADRHSRRPRARAGVASGDRSRDRSPPSSKPSPSKTPPGSGATGVPSLSRQAGNDHSRSDVDRLPPPTDTAAGRCADAARSSPPVAVASRARRLRYLDSPLLGLA
jgi:hypothetical protein